MSDAYVPKMSYDDLSGLLDDVDFLYVDGQLSDVEYDEEWNAVVEMSGWTKEEFFDELDRRWGESLQSPAESRES